MTETAAPRSWQDRIVGTGEMAPDQFLANPYNFRIHSAIQEEALEEVLDRVGWVRRVLVNRTTGHVLDGHLRVKLAMSRGETSVPYDEVELTEQEEKLVLASLDPIAGMAGTDARILAELTRDLDISEDGSLRKMLDELERDNRTKEPKSGQTDPDAVPEMRATSVRRGDIYQLGEHRLMCGDSTNPGDIDRLFDDGAKAAMVFTDPPYGVAYRDTGAGAWNEAKLEKKRAGLLRPRFNAIANDDLDEEQLLEFLRAYMLAQSRIIAPKAAQYVCHASLRAHVFREALVSTGYVPRAELIWYKSRPGFNFAHYKHSHEPIYYAAPIGGSLEWYGDNCQTTVWEVASESGATYEHPTQKPVGLVVKAINNSSAPGEVVYEPFSGSGSTLIAAEMTGRKCYACELDPQYVQVAIDRWQEFTGQVAVKIGEAEHQPEPEMETPHE